MRQNAMVKTQKILHGVQEVGGSNPLTQIFVVSSLGVAQFG